MHFILTYEGAPDYLQKRPTYRQEHIALVNDAHARGEIVMAGALADPVDGAVLVFWGESPEVAENFARNDPYVKSGMVKSWKVRKWTTVVGPGSVPVQI